jgi:hypothetical protein
MSRIARRATVAVAAALALALAVSPAAGASSSLESIFQDDSALVNRGGDFARTSLDELRGLGVTTIHSLVIWAQVAPDRSEVTRPDGFDPTDPASYDQARWAKWDTLVRETSSRGLGLILTPAIPSPAWAGDCTTKRRRELCVNRPSPKQFGQFITAVAKRYSGTYPDPANTGSVLPRVSRWSFLNEPNLGAWLTPQYKKIGNRTVPVGAKYARDLLKAAITAMKANGHASDQFYGAETAPVGATTGKLATRKNPPRSFLRSLFCLTSSGGKLVDSRIGCKRSFTRLGLTGITHHPYTLGAGSAPFGRVARDDITIGTLSRLNAVLRQAASRGRISKAAARRIYLDEFGFQTDPPDDTFGVSFNRQSEYINLGDFIAYRTRGVRGASQYELYDDPAKASFNTGLRMCDRTDIGECLAMLQANDLEAGEKKPSFDAYRLPLYVVRVSATKVRVFGWVRPARSAQTVRIRIVTTRSDGSKKERTIDATTRANGILDTRVARPSGSPRYQLLWGGFTSRTARVALR